MIPDVMLLPALWVEDVDGDGVDDFDYIIFAAWALNSFHLWLEASTQLEQIGTIISGLLFGPLTSRLGTTV